MLELDDTLSDCVAVDVCMVSVTDSVDVVDAAEIVVSGSAIVVETTVEPSLVEPVIVESALVVVVTSSVVTAVPAADAVVNSVVDVVVASIILVVVMGGIVLVAIADVVPSKDTVVTTEVGLGDGEVEAAGGTSLSAGPHPWWISAIAIVAETFIVTAKTKR